MAVDPRTKFVDLAVGRLAYQVLEGGSDGYVVWYQDAIQHLDLLWTDDSISECFGSLGPAGLTSILLQQRGVGLSDPVERPATIEEQAADLIAVLDAERVGRATLVSTAATSLPVALVSVLYPDRVQGIVMIGPGYVGARVTDNEFGWTPQLALDCIEGHRRAARDWGSGGVLRLWDAGLATPYNLRLTGMAERCSVRSTAMAEAVINTWLTIDGREIYPQVRSRTRVLTVPGGLWPSSRYVADAIPGAEYFELEPSQLGDSLGRAWTQYSRHVVEVALGEGAAPSGPERVLATVLFTDIVSSTDQLARIGDTKWGIVLEKHDLMLSRHVARYGGRYVKGTGDGALCEFASSAAAVECAQAACVGAAELGVEIRAGVHFGECSRRSSDLAGLAVHIGARVCSAAGPGEVYVSRAVRDLVAGSGVTFVTRGQHTLKGVPDTWELFAADGAGAPPAAPAAVRAPRASDRMVIGLSRRAPGALRAANRFATAAQKRFYAQRASA